MRLRKGQRLYALVPNIFDEPPTYCEVEITKTDTRGTWCDALFIVGALDRTTRYLNAASVNVPAGWWTTRAGAERDHALYVLSGRGGS